MDNLEINLQTPYRNNLQWYHYVGDFLNMLKAFIGTNYQGLAFAFSRSGLVLGFVGVFIVASLTDHCIQLLVVCKSTVIKKMCEEKFSKGKFTVRELSKFRQRLEQTVGYADISHYVLGGFFYHLTQFAIWFTQFATIVAYFIVMGNTIYELFPIFENTNDNTTSSAPNSTALFNFSTVWTTPSSNVSLSSATSHNLSTATWTATANITSIAIISKNFSTVTLPFTTTPLVYNEITTSIPSIFILYPESLLMLCILVPLPILMLTSLIRRVRLLAPFSTIATIALVIGASAVLGCVIDGFTICSNYELWKFLSLPLFFAQLTANFEGIGCLLPIHSSMEGNRHLFSPYLHVNVFLVFLILCTFGSLGYLRYGNDVDQLIIKNIPQHGLVPRLIDVTIIISVLFTYPLQCFPVLEIGEAYFFGEGKCCGPKPDSMKNMAKEDAVNYVVDEVPDNILNESSSLLDSQKSVRSIEESVSEAAVIVSPKVATWKRNTLRILVTIVTAVCAVVTRNAFAYVNAFSGAIAASLLSFVFPCLIHVRLQYEELSCFTTAKDIAIIAFSLIVSILSLVLIAQNFIHGGIL